MKFPVLPPYTGSTNTVKYDIKYDTEYDSEYDIKCDMRYYIKYYMKYSSKRSPAVSAASAHICIARQFRDLSLARIPLRHPCPKFPG